jgi:hypothetical protein
VWLDPQVKAAHKRPPGWTAPGPQPQADASVAPPAPHETLSFLTGDWRIFQLRAGHRWAVVRGDTRCCCCLSRPLCAAQLLLVRHKRARACVVWVITHLPRWQLASAVPCPCRAGGAWTT